MGSGPEHAANLANDRLGPAHPRLEVRIGSEITLRRLQIFWAVAHTTSLTKAAKLLGVSQPSLSQQLGSLEATIGGRLFDRLSNSMALTDLGASLLDKAEDVLRSLQTFEDSLPQAGTARRQTIRIAGVTSAMRMILPASLRTLRETQPHLDFDVIEAAPAEILDLLYARRVSLGLIPAKAVSGAGAGFQQLTVLEDPYVLVVPEALDLAGVRDPMRDLSAADRDLLNSTIHFVFGNHHSRRVHDWYDRTLPGNRLTANARSFEMVLEMVRGRLGVCVAPSLSVLSGSGPIGGVRLYRTDLEPRRVVAMFPAHCRHQQPYDRLLTELAQAGAALRLPAPLPMPPFVADAAGPERAPDRPSL